MKKLKLLSGFLAICLCIGLLSFPVKASETTDAGSAPAAITPVSLVTGDEDISSFQSYDLTIPVSSKSLVVPITLGYKGQLKINLAGKTVENSATVTLFSDEACTSKVGYPAYLSQDSNDTLKGSIPAKGTYYLKLETSKYSTTDAVVTITPYSFSSENKTLKNKEWIGTHPYSDQDKVNSHKIVINSPGYIKVESASVLDSNSSIYVTLSNSSKKALTEQTYLYSSNQYTAYFAVKQGTYYLTTQSYYDYKLRYTFTSVKESANSSKAKATTISKGKTITGLALAEDSTNKEDWYKVKLTKKQILSLGVYAKSSDTICFEVIPANSKFILMGSTFRLYLNDGGEYGTKDSLPAGTYYIKVTKASKTTSGYYTIKFN